MATPWSTWYRICLISLANHSFITFTIRPKGMQNNNIFRLSKIFHAPLEVIQNTPNCGGPLNTSGKIIITWSEVSSNPLPDPVVNYWSPLKYSLSIITKISFSEYKCHTWIFSWSIVYLAEHMQIQPYLDDHVLVFSWSYANKGLVFRRSSDFYQSLRST